MPQDSPIQPVVTHLTTPESFNDELLEIRDRAYQHLFRSRRLAVGDTIRVVDGEGAARKGLIREIDRKRATLELGEPLPSNEPALRIHLKVGALRPERADWLVEKTTELGVFSITFMATERTPRNYGQGRLDRLKRVASAAVEQSRRARLPTLNAVVPWTEILKDLTPVSYVLHPGGRRFDDLPIHAPDTRDISLLIGPEGGFTTGEIGRLKDRGTILMDCGTTVLRVETAAITACALWLQTEPSGRRLGR